jgi:hypothetical protein
VWWVGHRKNHVASSCYLAGWAGGDGYLRAIEPPVIDSNPAKPETVAYRRYFWGRHARVRATVEEALGRVESDFAKALRALPESWPAERGSRNWFAFAYLVAIHILRTPSAQSRMLALSTAALGPRLARFPHWTPDQQHDFVRHVTGDSWRADLFGSQLTQLASLIASMHWTLLEFDERLLATSDQPVTVVPLLSAGSAAPLEPVPRTGLAECEEIRMPLDPRRALLLTWRNLPDDAPTIRVRDDIAVQLNRAVIGQADQQWFHHPDRRPTTLDATFAADGVCRAIGRMLLPGYGYDEAIGSQRRLDTLHNLQTMVEDRVPGELRIAGVKRAAA